jgi:hypothetical protein
MPVHAYLVALQNIKLHDIMWISNSIDVYCLAPHYKQVIIVAVAGY